MHVMALAAHVAPFAALVMAMAHSPRTLVLKVGAILLDEGHADHHGPITPNHLPLGLGVFAVIQSLATASCVSALLCRPLAA